MKQLLLVLFLLVMSSLRLTAAPDTATYRHLAHETETSLQRDVLREWFPRAVDPKGGFFENYNVDWLPGADGVRSIVYQARLTWIAAQAAGRCPQQKAMYLGATRHGLDFLDKRLWDQERGGFYWAVDPQGRPTADRGTDKHAYGISFGLYAACAAYRATHDPRALDLARRAYTWLDTHAHDAKNGGYYEALTRDGTPILVPASAPGSLTADAIGTPYGQKSMNTHIHLLESLTALYQIWPDKGLRARLEEMFALVRDRIAVVPPGRLTMFFTPDWHPISDKDSFGHDVETAYLLTETASVLGRPNDARTWRVARSLVDHALAYGWDTAHGGFDNEGLPFGPPSDTSKVWWVQAEGLNALLLMHARYGRVTPRYWDAFQKQWGFVRKYQIDAVHGGWYPSVSAAGVPPTGRAKSDSWTEAYHQGRALINVTDTLRRLARPENRTLLLTMPTPKRTL